MVCRSERTNCAKRGESPRFGYAEPLCGVGSRAPNRATFTFFNFPASLKKEHAAWPNPQHRFAEPPRRRRFQPVAKPCGTARRRPDSGQSCCCPPESGLKLGDNIRRTACRQNVAGAGRISPSLTVCCKLLAEKRVGPWPSPKISWLRCCSLPPWSRLAVAAAPVTGGPGFQRLDRDRGLVRGADADLVCRAPLGNGLLFPRNPPLVASPVD